MEAETYLSEGYGLRLAIEGKERGWDRFNALASASAPPRIKQVLVSAENGTPYLNTSQVFDARPQARKWLAMSKTNSAAERLVKSGTILVMASATVGRAIIANKLHEGKIISHHFMRVIPNNPEMSGWVYAFRRSPQGQAMMKGSQYASIIRHIEPHHLASLPVPLVSGSDAQHFANRVQSIVELRETAAALTEEAEQKYASAIGLGDQKPSETGFVVRASEFFEARRRFEGAYHAPGPRRIIASFGRWEYLKDLTKRIWWPTRFKRIHGDSGAPYMSADDLFTTNPYENQFILVEGKADRDDLVVEPGWIVMARSGQTYGLNGSARLTSEYHTTFFLSDDLIRIIPDQSKARAGYLLTALTHPLLGRPLVIREAYGMSIPHLDPFDVARIPIARLAPKVENAIADLAEESAAQQAKADALERLVGDEANRIITQFLASPSA